MVAEKSLVPDPNAGLSRLAGSAGPAIFDRVQIRPHGRSLVWMVGKDADDVVDLCADVFWSMAHPEDRKLPQVSAAGQPE
jgi:hypothetical protein